MTYTTLAVFGFIYLFLAIYVLLAMCAAARVVRAGWKRRNRRGGRLARLLAANGVLK